MNAGLVRLGVWALPIAGVLIFLSWFAFLGGPSVSQDPDGYARTSTSSLVIAAGYTYLAGLLFLIVGLLGVYVSLPRTASPWPTIGTLLTVAGTALVLPVFGILVIAGPVLGDVYLAGHKDVSAAMLQLAGGSFSPRIIAYFVVLMLVSLVGAIATAFAIWSSGLLPKWSGVLFALGFVLTIASAPLVTHIGALLLVAAGVWMARGLAQTASAVGAAEPRPTPA
jgi:hypothetical protein